MSQEETNVKIGADTGELAAGMQTAETTVQSAATSMQASMQQMTSSVTSSVTTMQNEVKAHFASIGSSISKVTGLFAGMAALAAGGSAFGKVISATNEWTGEALKLGKQMGVTAGQASVLMTAAQQMGLSFDQIEGTIKGFVRNLKANEDGIKAMGIATTDSVGKTRNMVDIMLEANQVLLGYKEGKDRDIAMMTVYGRAALENAKFLQLNAAAMQEAKRRAEELGLLVGGEAVQQFKKFKSEQNDMKLMLKSLEIQVGNAVIPVFTELGAWFSKLGPDAINIFKGALNGLVTFFEYVVLGVVTIYETVKMVFRQIIDSALSFSSVLNKLMAGDFSGAWEEAKKGAAQFGETGEQALNRIAAAANKTNDSVAKLWGLKEKGKAADLPESEGKQFEGGSGGAGNGGGGSAEKSRLSDWRSYLEEKKEAENEYFKDSKAADLSYWETVNQRTDLSATEQKEVRHEIYQAKKSIAHEELAAELTNLKAQHDAALTGSQQRITIAQQEADLIKSTYGEESKEYAAAQREISRQQKEYAADQVARQLLTVDKEKELALNSIEIERNRLSAMKSMGAVNDKEEYTATVNLTNKEHAVEMNAYQQKLALAKQGSTEEQSIMNQMEVAEAKHVKTLNKLNSTAATTAVSQWKSAATSIGTAIGTAFSSMATGSQKFSKTMKTLATSIVSTMAQAGANMLSDWIIKQFAMTTAEQTGQTTRTALASTGETTRKAITTASATSQMTANAGVAASGAAASQAEIPIVGPVLAAVASAAMMALVTGMMSMASAEGGYDIPSGVNPVTQLHQDEMVLPSHLADKVRNMSDQPQQQTAAVNFHVTAMDAKSVKKFFNQHGSSLADSISSQYRNFKGVRA